jgi:hypothetical protein
MALAPGTVGGSDTFSFYTGALPGAASGAVYPSNLPNAAGLESLSSRDIESLLNPPSMFPDTNRRAAEVTAGRGVGGSAAAYGTGLRMTDEERIRRMALGEQMLSGAYQRTQPYNITPYQGQQLGLERDRLQLERDRLNAMMAAGYFNRGGAGGAGRGGAGGTDFGTSVSRGLTDFPWTDLTAAGGGPDLTGVYRGAPGGGVTPGPAYQQPGLGGYGDFVAPGMDFPAPGTDVAGAGMNYGGDLGGGMSAQDYIDLIGGDFMGGGGEGGGAPATGLDFWNYDYGE